MGRLSGKRILITGSTAGIGAGIAKMAAMEGARVLIHGRSQTEADQTLSAIRDAGGHAEVVLADLMDPETPRRLVDAAVTAFGGLDGLVNNAGISPRSTLESTTPEFFDRVIGTNLKAPLFVTQAAYPHLIRAGGGSIVNIGSVNAYMGWHRLVDYSISKGGMMTMTRNLATGLAMDRIRVNQLNVGWTWTENEHQIQVGDGAPEDWASRIDRSWIPFGRMLNPEDIAYAAVFLLSDESALMNGAVIDLTQVPPLFTVRRRDSESDDVLGNLKTPSKESTS